MGVFINNKIIVEKKRKRANKNENAELLFKQAMSEMEIEGLKSENSDLMVRVALLEMGGITNE
jgi:hypothetical protein